MASRAGEHGARTLFDSFRKSLEDLINGSTPPEERREIVARMRETLVRAKMGIGDLRDGLDRSRRALGKEEAEVETMRRRQRLATDVGDTETAALAERYAGIHAERAAVLRRKVEAQEAELSLAEGEVASMTAELKAAASGTGASAPRAVDPALDDPVSGADEALAQDLDALARSRARADREAEAARKLDELKRRMQR